MNVRPYEEAKDFEEIKRWAKVHPGIDLVPEALSPTTFVMETSQGRSVASVSVLLTNCKYYCMMEGLFLNPDAPMRVRAYAMEHIYWWVEEFAKHLGYKGVLVLPISDKMERHFKNVGFGTIQRGVSMYKRIGE